LASDSNWVVAVLMAFGLLVTVLPFGVVAAVDLLHDLDAHYI
jgi:hypothetical protein